MVYLPKELESQIRRATESFQQALSLLEELNTEARLRLDKSKSKPKKKSAKKKSVSKKCSTKKKPPKRT